MVHGYFDINLDVVWETVDEWLPALLEQLSEVWRAAADHAGPNNESTAL
jgi:uncharacterized protein with HEPN domain